MSETVEEHAFDAEVSQLLKMMINSVYSNREVFLRELISNASDAIDRLRLEGLEDESLLEGDTEFEIRIDFDGDQKTITVEDNGIGMDREQIQDDLGTIARSGTKEFMEKLSSTGQVDEDMIGQFGVGFYSAFMVAEQIHVESRRAGLEADEAVYWKSAGEGTYEIGETEREARGTEITLHLSDDAEEFLDRERLSDIVKEYSDHISFPIVMPDEEGEDERINRASALWTRRPSDITADEYEEFYKHVAHDFEEPLTYTHRHVEGRLKFSMLFYVPKQRPFDLKREPESTTEGVKLYVRRVFILDDAVMFLPRYLRFIRGVIDSDDLDLNVSREFLQENRVVAAMRSTAVNKVLDMLSELSEDDEQYQTFWDEFGDIFKEGVVEDDKHSDEIAELLRFASTHEDEELQTVSLDDYVERMPDDQDEIYYITADTFAAAQNSPHLEAFRDNDLEVLLMYEPIDEWVVNSLHEYDGYELQSIARGDVDLDVDEQEDGDREEPDSDEFADLIETFESHLSEDVQDVRLSSRLTESPACLVASEGGITGNMDRILKAAGQASPGFQPILELNPTHPIIQRLNENPGDEHMDDWVQVIFDQALIGEGGKLENPGDYTRRLNRLMTELMQ